MDDRFELAGAWDLEDIRRFTADIWADLAFDEDGKAALRCDGFAIESLRLTGPNPSILSVQADGRISVSATGPRDGAALIDLWRLYVMRRLRDGRGHRDAA